MFLLILVIFGWQVQGGIAQQIQVTPPNNQSVQHATVTIQSDQEDGDNLQPTLGGRVYQ